jgi:predicted transcriptional regulator
LHAPIIKPRMQARRNRMSLMKAPPKQSKNVTLQLRVDEELKTKLDKYAEFLDSTESYVVSESLKVIFNKDAEFKEWLERQGESGGKSAGEQTSVMTEKGKHSTTFTGPAPKTNGNQLFK